MLPIPFKLIRYIHYYSYMMLFVFLMDSCERSTTPLGPVSSQFTSHDYEWTIDTLRAPDALQVLAKSVWGINENKVWVVGHSDETKYQFWYWDGSKWENQYLLFPGHPHSLKDIYGFSESDIWVVGIDIQNYPNTEFRNFIIHFNGVSWELLENINAPWCFSIWGISRQNLFVGSDSGLILHYDGNIWKRQITGTYSQILSIWGFSENEIYATGVQRDNKPPMDTTFYYLFKYDGQNWEINNFALDYSFASPLSFGSHLWGDEYHNLYSVGPDGLYKMINNFWVSLLNGNFYAIDGTGWNNIFIGGPWNNIYHFNGNFWNRFDFFDKYFFDAGFDFWCNTKNIFMTAQESNQSYVVRGKLIEP
jgi:hypothetical protein